MATAKLPERASLEYLKKLAKERLQKLRRTDPRAKLAAAQLAVARDHGFPTWRALKAEVERRQAGNVDRFFEACAKGDIATVRALLLSKPGLTRADNPHGAHRGWTGLHTAARQGHLDVVRFLLEHGADPNAREAGDNTYPLHWAAAGRHVDTVRALLDAGGDVHGIGDVHELDAIGWATFYHPHDGAPGDKPEVASLLLERGARHHIFSVMSVGDMDAIRELVEEDPEALNRRMSRFEKNLTVLHFAIAGKRYAVLDLLIELGADLEATDQSGQTAYAIALGRGDREATRRLQAAGAKPPKPVDSASVRAGMAKLAGAVREIVPMIHAPDVAATLAWYTSIGFTECGRYGQAGGVPNWGTMSFGKAQIMLNMYGNPADRSASLWIYTAKIDQLYQLLKSRQLTEAQAALTGEPGVQPGIEFEEDLYEPFYGGRQFGIKDPNGYSLIFYEE